MRISRWTLLLPLAAACSNDVPTDTFGDPASRVIAPGGAITGNMTYQGPHPCSANGHIVGNGIVLLFDRRVPPPPAGLAATAVNFAVVVGDALFPNEPRWTGSTPYCPLDHGIEDSITVSAPFQVGPLAPASYIIQSFYDYTGDFLPTFKFRELPEKGDIGGGDIDLTAALQPINQNPNYMPSFQPIDVGIPQRLEADAAPGTIPLFTIPPQGFVAQNVQVTVGSVFQNTRPYFYAEGLNAVSTTTTMGTCPGPMCFQTVTQTVTEAQSSAQYWGPTTTKCPAPVCNGGSKTGIAGSTEFQDQTKAWDGSNNQDYYMPILTIPADIQTFAPPVSAVLAGSNGANKFESGGMNSKMQPVSGLPHLRLRWEGSDSRQQQAAAGAPFNMQLDSSGGMLTTNGFDIWQSEWLNPSGKLPDGTMGPIWAPMAIPDSTYKTSGAPVPLFWPAVILSKLVDDPTHESDPASLTAQGDATHPVVIMQGITLWGGDSAMPTGPTDDDSLFTTVSESVLIDPHHYVDAAGNPVIFHQDHLTALLRPAAICFNQLFNANESDKRGNLVTPYLFGESTDSPPVPNTPIVPLDLLTNNDPVRQQVTNLVKAPPNLAPNTPPAIAGCLPQGRYAINVVYPDGQAWTVPNEAGACTGTATGEGNTQWTNYTCTIQTRSVIQSQGPRAVVEIVAPTNPMNCGKGGPVPATPPICLPTKSSD